MISTARIEEEDIDSECHSKRTENRGRKPLEFSLKQDKIVANIARLQEEVQRCQDLRKKRAIKNQLYTYNSRLTKLVADDQKE